ncbi:MAG: hypothetical protein WCF36_21905 [Candidatus Nanopelagicales bacterium]
MVARPELTPQALGPSGQLMALGTDVMPVRPSWSSDIESDLGEAPASSARRACSSAAIEVAGHQVHVRMSIGLARVGSDESAEDILQRADLSMYRVRALGGGQTVVAD